MTLRNGDWSAALVPSCKSQDGVVLWVEKFARLVSLEPTKGPYVVKLLLDN